MEEKLAEILTPYRGERGTLIPILQKVQQSLGYLSPEAASQISDSSRSDTLWGGLFYTHIPSFTGVMVMRCAGYGGFKLGPDESVEMNLNDRSK